MIPNPEDQPTMSLWPEVGEALGLSRNTVYAEARRFEQSGGAAGIPVIRFGTRLRVPTAALRQLLELDPPPSGPGRSLRLVEEPAHGAA